MAGYSIFDSGSINSLFSSLNSSNSNNNFMNFGVDLSTYNQIRAGSYSKLMKAYYNIDESNSAVNSIASTSTSKDSSKIIAQIQDSSSELKDAASALYKSNSSVFKQDSEGNYDRDAISKAVEKFVDGYNSTIKATAKSNTTSIANNSQSLINYAASNLKMLSKLGISIDAGDYTLKLDKETLGKANIADIKSTMAGNGSFAYGVALKASMIESNAKLEASKSNTYNKAGDFTYNYSTGEIYKTEV